MKRIILLFFIMIFGVLNVQAKSMKADINGIINSAGIDKNAISVSVKNAKNGNVVYALNDKMLVNPASIQKILTMTAAVDKLGLDYKFKTEMYSLGKKTYLLKLSGDPYLVNSDLNTLVAPVKKDAVQLYIDDSILDSKTWGEGWQWDDDMNTYTPKFSAYNLDGNLIKLSLLPSSNGQFATILNPSKYPFVFYNNVTSSSSTDINVKRESDISPNILTLSGTIAKQKTIYVPSMNLKLYFEIQLTKALEEHNVYIKNPYKIGKHKSADVLESSVEHELTDAISDILKTSNNLAAETVFKLAGGGSDLGGISVFNDYCLKNNIDNTKIRITDGSGVSKNNLVSSDFVSEFLFKNKDNQVMTYLPTPGEGTLAQRMLPLKESLKAKTGTLSGISSIAGYIKSKKGHDYVFCIVQNDVNLSNSDKKMLEDYIIREIYLKL